MEIRFSDLVQLISGPRFDRGPDGELVVRVDGHETKIPFGSLTASERSALMHFIAEDGLIGDPSQIPHGEPTVTLFEITSPDGTYWAPANMVILPQERWAAVEYLERGGLLAKFSINTLPGKKPMLSTQTKVEASLNEAGDLIVVRDGKEIATIERSSISDESRNALTAFVKVCGEPTSIEEWDGKPVIADRPVALHDQHGLPFTVLRGQALDDYDLIVSTPANRRAPTPAIAPARRGT